MRLFSENLGGSGRGMARRGAAWRVLWVHYGGLGGAGFGSAVPGMARRGLAW